MTDGHDGADDRPADGGAGRSRDREDGGDADRRSQREEGPSDTRTGPGDGVEIAGRAMGDGDWVDLGDRAPGGEAFATGDLPAERLREYTTGRRSLDPLVQVRWGLRVVVGAFVVGLVATWGLGALDVGRQWGGAVVGVLLLLGLVWVVLHYRRWIYEIRADAIYLERGVVTHVRTLVPYVRIQHVDTSRSPVERMLGLSTLVVYTAGSRGADVSIPGLKPEEARDLQHRVKELAIEAEGDDAL